MIIIITITLDMLTLQTHLTRSSKMFMIVRNKKQRIHDKFVNETGRFLQQIEQKSTERFKKHMEYMKIIVKQSISLSESVETSLNNVEKDFRKIGEGGLCHQKNYMQFM